MILENIRKSANKRWLKPISEYTRKKLIEKRNLRPPTSEESKSKMRKTKTKEHKENMKKGWSLRRERLKNIS
jgi:hypothetical protein